MGIPQLPNEIWMQIIRNACESDSESGSRWVWKRNLAMVNTLFHGIVRTTVHRSVTIKTHRLGPHHSKGLSKDAKFFTQKEIGCCVREADLSFRGHTGIEDPDPTSWSGLQREDFKNYIQEPLLKIFRAFSRLKSVQIHAYKNKGKDEDMMLQVMLHQIFARIEFPSLERMMFRTDKLHTASFLWTVPPAQFGPRGLHENIKRLRTFSIEGESEHAPIRTKQDELKDLGQFICTLSNLRKLRLSHLRPNENETMVSNFGLPLQSPHHASQISDLRLDSIEIDSGLSEFLTSVGKAETLQYVHLRHVAILDSKDKWADVFVALRRNKGLKCCSIDYVNYAEGYEPDGDDIESLNRLGEGLGSRGSIRERIQTKPRIFDYHSPYSADCNSHKHGSF